MTKSIAIVGAGQAAAQCCMSLRQFGFDGKITVFGEESEPPYQRPPLSKAYMKGELDRERLFLKPRDWYEQQDVSLRLGQKVNAVEKLGSSFKIIAGMDEVCDTVVFATGSRPRALPVPGANLQGVFDLRSLSDVDAIKSFAKDKEKWVIIGGGYIGLEAAAVARQLGVKVTVVEMADRVLSRVTSEPVSEFYQHLHRSNGAEILTGARLNEILGDTSVAGIKLSDGSEIEADLVLSGIGIVPNTELAEASGVSCENGIIVDEDAQTSLPNVYAAGDCCVRPLVQYGRMGRLESVHNAIEQGKIVAASIMERDRPKEDCPWFWSDQYDVKLQIAGLSEGCDHVVTRGSADEQKLAFFYFREGQLIAVDAINSPPEFMVSKQIIQKGGTLDPELLSRSDMSMKEIAAQSG